MADMSMCYILSIIVSIALAVYGLSDIIAQRRPEEITEQEVISRQIRGFGLLVLAQFVVLLGGAACSALSSGVERLMRDVGNLLVN